MDAASLGTFTLPVDRSSDFDTGIAFFNSGTEDVILSRRLLDGSGSIVDSALPLSLQSKGHLAQFVSEMFPGLGTFRGSVSISASGEVEALTLRQNNVPLTFTTLPVAFRAGPTVMTGTWEGSYDLTVDLQGLCSNLSSLTHSGDLTVTVSQSGVNFSGTATMTGVQEFQVNGMSSCSLAGVLTLIGEVSGTVLGQSVTGQLASTANRLKCWQRMCCLRSQALRTSTLQERSVTITRL